MSEQLELVPRPEPSDLEAMAEQLCLFLDGRGWVPRRHIEKHFGWDEKKIRDVRAAANGRVFSYPSAPGYRLTRQTTPEMVARGVAAGRSQIKHMDENITEMIRAAHRYVAGFRDAEMAS